MPSVDPVIRSHQAGCARVLLVGRDRRYLTEAGRRLRALDYEVATTCRPSEIIDLVRRLDLNVAVVDGSHYLAAIVRSMAAIDAVGTRLAVLTVVDDALISPLSRPDVMPKWASLDRIDEHVELAFELRASRNGGALPEPGVAFA